MPNLLATDFVFRVALSLKPDFDSGAWRWAVAGPGLLAQGQVSATDREDAVLWAIHALAERGRDEAVEVGVSLPPTCRLWSLADDIRRTYPGVSVVPYGEADAPLRCEAMALLEPGRVVPERSALPQLTVATDGSAHAGHLGWGWLAADGQHGHGATRLRAGTISAPCRPLVAEVRAIGAAVAAVRDRDVLIRSDSRHALTLIADWLAGLERLPSGYRVSRHAAESPGGLLNVRRRLVREADRLSFEWVRGHAGDPLNEGADSLAKLARRYSQGTWGLTDDELPSRAAAIASTFAQLDDRRSAA